MCCKKGVKKGPPLLCALTPRSDRTEHPRTRAIAAREFGFGVEAALRMATLLLVRREGVAPYS